MLLGAALIMVSGCGPKPEPETETVSSASAAPEPRPMQTSLPPRAPGLWKMVITEEGSADPPQNLQICINAEVDKHLGIMGSDLSGDRCQRTVSNLTADSWGILATCVMGAGVTTEYSGSIEGDFSKAYTMQVRAQTTGNNMPQMDRLAIYKIDAKFAGRCPSGYVPGDIASGEFRFNLFDMAGMNRDGEPEADFHGE